MVGYVISLGSEDLMLRTADAASKRAASISVPLLKETCIVPPPLDEVEDTPDTWSSPDSTPSSLEVASASTVSAEAFG